jgi:hypothetical protein
LHDRLPSDLLCITSWHNPSRAEAIPKKPTIIDKVSREATACLGKCKAILSLIFLNFCFVFKDEDLAMIAAQQYFVEYGNNLNPERLQTLLGSYILDLHLQKPNAADLWMKHIVSKLRSPYFSNERIKPEKVRFFPHLPSTPLSTHPKKGFCN